jgi:diguanylate cyclase (GGDEF)-like protein
MTVGICLAIAMVALFQPNGTGKTTVIVVLLLLAPAPPYILSLLRKVMDEQMAAAQRFATRDALTDLYNQNTFWDLLSYEIERSKRQHYRFSLLLVDIDNFKAINDRYGHEAGDAVLIRFADILKRTIRKGDIPARYAGDNFAAILPVCDEAQAHVVAKRFLDSVRDEIVTLSDGHRVQITASGGIAVFPHHARDAQDLFLMADGMLGQAKMTGKDRLTAPVEDMDLVKLKSAGEKSVMVMEAIRERRIVPYFQPIISVDGSQVLAYEVLTRIVTPDRVVPAAEFIDVAESMGAISRLNLMLMDQAFRLANETGYRGTLFLNLSPKALILSDFLPGVKSLMREHKFDSSRIVFEITERDTVKNPRMIERVVRELRQEGFQFAIDDFGSGYSSFQYIRLFDVAYLKVDGEFIRNMGGAQGTEKAIVSNIASLASDLGIKTIAEYVETEAIMEHVRSSGIQYAQGYYINRPSPNLSYRVGSD